MFCHFASFRVCIIQAYRTSIVSAASERPVAEVLSRCFHRPTEATTSRRSSIVRLLLPFSSDSTEASRASISSASLTVLGVDFVTQTPSAVAGSSHTPSNRPSPDWNDTSFVWVRSEATEAGTGEMRNAERKSCRPPNSRGTTKARVGGPFSATKRKNENGRRVRQPLQPLQALQRSLGQTREFSGYRSWRAAASYSPEATASDGHCTRHSGALVATRYVERGKLGSCMVTAGKD